ncbi:unnamed protein product, partial [Laminaria digitata]
WEYDHDVLVVGGGIVGCSLTCRVAQDLATLNDTTTAATTAGASATTSSAAASGAARGGGVSASPAGGIGDASGRRRPSVGLIEARPPAPLAVAMAKDGPDPRVYSLTPSSVRVLRKIGVWDKEGDGGGGGKSVLAERSQPFGGMQVWDDRGPGHLRFDSEGGEGGNGKGALGFISEHGVIHSALFERARELEEEGLAELITSLSLPRHPPPSPFCSVQVKRVTFPSVGSGGAVGPIKVTVETAGGETSEVSCRLLVAADGGDSKVAKMLGLSSFGWGYGQRAVVATVSI